MEAEARRNKGPIAWMARNRIAANLLMFMVIAAGVIGILRTKQEVFPSFTMDVVQINLLYPGASPSEVEQGITLAVEEAVSGLEGVKQVTSNSTEGMSAVSVELLLGADRQQALADVKSAVDRIQSFPEDAQEPSVSLLSRRREVISLVISGDQDLKTLDSIAEKARADLLTHPDVKIPHSIFGALSSSFQVDAPPLTQIDLNGSRPLEVSIEIPRETLDSYGLTLDQVAAQIRAQSVEIPGGVVKTEGGEILVRLNDRRQDRRSFEDIILRSTADGSALRLGEIATVVDGYADTDQISTFNGKRAVRLTAFRVGNESPRGVAAVVKAYRDKLRAELPPEIDLTIWGDKSIMLDERIELLVTNGLMGLVLVFIILALLLDIRLALWVSLGIPISFMGTFFLMPSMDISINMISLFAFIVTLGMVVDDAIIVGENIFERTQHGVDPIVAAIDGAQEMAIPVTFSILTTCAAFAPLLFVPGVMGKLFQLLPMVVVTVLTISLLESFLILPSHLGHTNKVFTLIGALLGPTLRPIEWLRARVSGALDWFTEHAYKPSLSIAMRYRYITTAIAIATFFLTIGLVGSGFVSFTFFPKLEGDKVVATARFPYGTPLHQTEAVQRQLLEAASRAIDRSGGDTIVKGIFGRLAEGPPQGGPAPKAGILGSHITSVEINLVASDQREVTTRELAYRWEEELGPIAGLDSLVFNGATGGPSAGADVNVQLSHSDNTVLAAAAAELGKTLQTFPSLTSIQNSYADGKPQLDFKLNENGASLGLTASQIGRQVRAAFFGSEALREQRGRHEYKVMVRLPAEQRKSEYDLEELQIHTPRGYVPLHTVASTRRTKAPTLINRQSGRRIVSLTAELAKGHKSTRDILAKLNTTILPQLSKKYPGLTYEFAGVQREQSDTLSSLKQNFVLAAFVMFALLAIPFRSYAQPLIIMSAIPMGLVGAVGGHMLMGFQLSIISMFGIIALAGVVVNDSLVLVDAANRFRDEGATPMEAAIYGGVRRIRPILLTSLTTFMGLAPMIVEPSVQARFLIPMAISLGFGVLFTTFVTLILVPALYLILHDLEWAAAMFFAKFLDPSGM